MRTLLSTCLLAGLVLGLSLPNLPTQAATQLDALANQFNLYPVSAQDVLPTVAHDDGHDHDHDKGHHRNATLANGHDGHDDDDHDKGGHHRNATLANGHDGHDDDDHDKGGHHRISLAVGNTVAPTLANHGSDHDGDDDHGDHHLTAPAPACNSGGGHGEGGE